MEFEGFPKIPRFTKPVIITEKIDGTNGQVVVTEDGQVLAASRNRYITPENDNYGFAAWVKENEEQLRWLGPGRHFGEWYGQGIQRGYGLNHRRFALFAVHRYDEEHPCPPCCEVVPVLGTGVTFLDVETCLGILKSLGSAAVPGYMNPEGIIIYHTASKQMYKYTLDGDQHKG